jgi:hypothetical protein
MKLLKLFLIFFFVCSLIPGLLVAYIIFNSPGFSEKQCEVIKGNYKKLRIGMNKQEVLLLIGKEPGYQLTRYPGFFPEQNTVWEFWMLCKEKPYKWQMIAFDTETGKVVKNFSDDPERVGFE